ncbi:MAG TPA: cysteine/serine endopeptidase inhibitor [Lentzea sp.]
MTFTRKFLTVSGAAAALTLVATTDASAAIPFGQVVDGKATYYDDRGTGACGDPIDASSEVLVAVSPVYWTAPNPNNDRLCRNVFVVATFNGKTVRARVRDKCMGCGRDHIDLSLPAFRKLADPDRGVINLKWKFVRG